MSDEKRRRHGRDVSIVGPVILIALGTVFLLQNVGVLAGSAWLMLLQLWPVVIIAIGLEILLGRGSSVLGSLVALVLTLAILGASMWLLTTGALATAPSDVEIGELLEDATRAEVSLAPGVAALRVAALPSSSPYLATGLLHLGNNEQLERSFDRAGSMLTLDLNSESSGPVVMIGGWEDSYSWDLSLTPNVPIDLEADLAVGEAEIDLTGLAVDHLDVSCGVGQVTVVLPDEGRFDASLDGGIGQTVIVVPAGMEARIDFSTGIAGRRVPPGYTCEHGVCTSPGFDGADQRVDLWVSQAIGEVVVREE
ncbi:MAG: hypothetical protein JXD18_06335 [Anaerolineae bacterium]|nr:hypothetical protein [Anaerolineae bacterium]